MSYVDPMQGDLFTSTHARSSDPETARQAGRSASDTIARTRMEEVFRYFIDTQHRWIARWEFTNPNVGGSQGDRRLRDAAKLVPGFAYEAKQFDGNWWYRTSKFNDRPVPEPSAPHPRTSPVCPHCRRP